jgi:hypothetical protein
MSRSKTLLFVCIADYSKLVEVVDEFRNSLTRTQNSSHNLEIWCFVSNTSKAGRNDKPTLVVSMVPSHWEHSKATQQLVIVLVDLNILMIGHDDILQLDHKERCGRNSHVLAEETY